MNRDGVRRAGRRCRDISLFCGLHSCRVLAVGIDMTAATQPTFAEGKLLAGKYRIGRILGEGGMGLVLAAENEALRQRVAIKVLRANRLSQPNAFQRFLREARAAASLRSEHVARVLDVGSLEDGCPFMVMEILEG